jgi:hypothetical protein
LFERHSETIRRKKEREKKEIVERKRKESMQLSHKELE